jgi:hypothetical protein
MEHWLWCAAAPVACAAAPVACAAAPVVACAVAPVACAVAPVVACAVAPVACAVAPVATSWSDWSGLIEHESALVRTRARDAATDAQRQPPVRPVEAETVAPEHETGAHGVETKETDARDARDRRTRARDRRAGRRDARDRRAHGSRCGCRRR